MPLGRGLVRAGLTIRGHHGSDGLDAEPQPRPVALPNRHSTQPSLVGVHPIALDPHHPRDLVGVDQANTDGAAEFFRDKFGDRLDVPVVEDHVSPPERDLADRLRPCATLAGLALTARCEPLEFVPWSGCSE